MDILTYNCVHGILHPHSMIHALYKRRCTPMFLCLASSSCSTSSSMTMAEKAALKKVEDQLNCSICLDVYTDPKMLHCFHVFCQTCLRKLVFRDEQGQLVLSCPNCHHITPVPANGVAGLQPAFLINQLLDIAEDLKRGKDAPVSAERAASAEGQTVALQALLKHKKRFLLSAWSMSEKK